MSAIGPPPGTAGDLFGGAVAPSDLIGLRIVVSGESEAGERESATILVNIRADSDIASALALLMDAIQAQGLGHYLPGSPPFEVDEMEIAAIVEGGWDNPLLTL